jgi:hypothetical protein
MLASSGIAMGAFVGSVPEELRAKIGTIIDDVWATLSFGVVVPTLSQHESLLPRVAVVLS